MSKNGSDILLRISVDGGVNYEYIAMSTEASYGRAKETREVMTKYSGGNAQLAKGGKKSFTINGSGFVVFASSEGHLTPSSFDSVFENGIRVWVEVVDVEDSVVRLVGQLEQANYDITSGTEDDLVYDLQFSGSQWFARGYLAYLDKQATKQGAVQVAGDCASALINSYRAISTT